MPSHATDVRVHGAVRAAAYGLIQGEKKHRQMNAATYTVRALVLVETSPMLAAWHDAKRSATSATKVTATHILSCVASQ